MQDPLSLHTYRISQYLYCVPFFSAPGTDPVLCVRPIAITTTNQAHTQGGFKGFLEPPLRQLYVKSPYLGQKCRSEPP